MKRGIGESENRRGYHGLIPRFSDSPHRPFINTLLTYSSTPILNFICFWYCS